MQDKVIDNIMVANIIGGTGVCGYHINTLSVTRIAKDLGGRLEWRYHVTKWYYVERRKPENIEKSFSV